MKRRKFMKTLLPFSIYLSILPSNIISKIENYNQNLKNNDYEEKSKQNQDRILKIFYKYENYAKIINTFKNKYKYIFEIPLEMLFPHIYFESDKFNQKAISDRLAVGMGQFMRRTAIDVGINVYDTTKYKDLLDLEAKIEINFEYLRILESGDKNEGIQGYWGLFKSKNYKQAIKIYEEYDSLKEENNKLVDNCNNKFVEYAEKDEEGDGRLNVETSIDKCCFLIAELSLESKKRYGNMNLFNIMHGISGYNYGPRSWNHSGFPQIYETANHISKVIEYYGALINRI